MLSEDERVVYGSAGVGDERSRSKVVSRQYAVTDLVASLVGRGPVSSGYRTLQPFDPTSCNIVFRKCMECNLLLE